METLLNLVWLAVTVAAIWLWRFRWTVSRRNPRHSTRMEAVAMVSVLALLFPVISLTDDLHPEIVPADTVSSKRNHCLLVANGGQTGNSKSPLNARSSCAFLPHAPSQFELVFAGLIPTTIVLSASSVSAPGSGR